MLPWQQQWNNAVITVPHLKLYQTLGTFIYSDGLLKYPRKYCIAYVTWLQTGGGIYGAGLGHAGSEIDMCMVAPHTLFPVPLTAHSASQAWPHHGPLAQHSNCTLS